MPRFLFRTPDLEDYEPGEEDWLEFPDLESAGIAAELALREMAAHGELGPGITKLSVFDETCSLAYLAELEVRIIPRGGGR